MAPILQNGHTNGTSANSFHRFQDIADVIDIPVRGEVEDEAVNLDLTELSDEIDELCVLLEDENAAIIYWITIALAYAKQQKIDTAIEIIRKALAAQIKGTHADKLGLLNVLCWLQLWQARHVPRVAPEGSIDAKTKDTWLQAATTTVNEASKIDPTYAPLYLARGVLSQMRAPLLTGRTGVGSTQDALVQAAKAFDDSLRLARGNNVMATMGKAKILYSQGRYAESLSLYQKALEASPELLLPDPRIGIGCCLWQLGHKEHAHAAWERALELSPDSAIAHQLVGIYYLDQCSHYSTSDEAFGDLYKKAMTVHTQQAFKQNDTQPLTCATFGNYFLLRKAWPTVDKLAKRAVELTDNATIASDGWYLRARQAHYQNDITMAADCYVKSDQARGGDEKGYAPAKFGAAQLRTLQKDHDGAKFRLEKMLSQHKSVEVQTLLGMLYAEDVFNNTAVTREERYADSRKAIALLEQVRLAWRDARRKLDPDSTVLLTLARLYESESPEKSLSCLLQVEQLELDGIADEDRPEGIDDVEEERRAMRELISPQLLNNVACFQFQAEKFALAREYFQTALNACVKREDDHNETDALVTTISYNLARVYEAENMNNEAKKVYDSLLLRHPDYSDASLRLAYIALSDDPTDGATNIKSLLDADPGNLEVRTMYGWYVNKSKKRTLALNEDQEQRHYKQTLQTYDKHDLYALTGMGNIHLAVAREMPRQTDQEKERRSKVYMRAVEFFDKVLTLDPRNAYAAQGLGIALIEDKKDKTNAMQIFSKVRETVKDPSVFINLGHVFADSGQFARSIENYEVALTKLKSTDPQQAVLLACLGRVWYTRGKTERVETRLESYKTSLAYSQRALEAAKGAKDEVNYSFNVAFVQMQIAQLVIVTAEAQRTSVDVQTATQGLDEAIDAFGEIAQAPNPPFPREIIEQRANMGRNTMKRQLATAMEKQEDYEHKNQSRLEEARRKREEDIRRREEEKMKAEAEAEEKRRKIREERERIMEEERQLIQQRIEEEKAREEADLTTDEATGERKKREKKKRGAGGDEKRRKRKKKSDDSEDDNINDSDDDEARNARSTATPASGSDGEEAAPRRKTKKRRLEKKSAAKQSKYKSSEMVEDSSDDDAGAAQLDEQLNDEAVPVVVEDEDMGDEESSRPKVRRPARILDDEDEE